MKIYQKIAQTVQAMKNCEKSGNQEWLNHHEDTIDRLCKEYMPHGSGFDCGTQFDFAESTPEKLVFKSSFHHMNDGGYYDGWSELKIVVTPSLSFGFSCRITGILRKYRYDDGFFYDAFNCALDQEVPQ